MAYGRFRKSYRNVRKFGFRSSARYGYKKFGGARGIAGFSLPWIAGGALGYAAPRINPYQDMIITAMAVLPIRLPYGLQNVAKGYVGGMLLRQVMPGIGGFGTAATNGSDVV